jgi:tetratricopeptide (TPR) repeat protein
MATVRSSSVVSCVVAGILLLPTYARADGDGARQHFETGKKLRDEGDCVRAIGEFEKSLSIDKSIGAYYNLGYCQEQLAHRQEAYEAYRHAQQLAGAKRDERLREISGALGSLLETPHVRLVFPQPLPAGLKITVDDQLVPDNFYTTETVIFTTASKSHVVTLTAPGYEERRESLGTKELKVIELRRAEADRTPSPAASIKESRPAAPAAWTTQHWLGLGLAAGGVASGAVISLLALDHLSNVDDIAGTYVKTRDACPKSAGFPEQGCETSARNRRNDDTRSENTRMLVTGGLVGAVALGLLVSGGVIFFNATRTSKGAQASGVKLHVVPTSQGVSVGGGF